MRSLKFRAWDKKRSKWLHDFQVMPGGEVRWLQFHGGTQLEWQSVNGDEVELMLFTGLLDRNSKEIYEGDVVRSSINGEVQQRVIDMSDGVAWFFGDGHAFDNSWIEFEVIGNTYESPELLEENAH